MTSARPLRSFTLLAGCGLALGLSGCGVILQTALGWSSTDAAERKTRQAEIRVSTLPAGAEISRKARDGETVVIGQSPLTDTVSYEVEEIEESPSGVGLLIGGAVELGVATGAFFYGRGEQKCFSDGDCHETVAPNDTALISAGVIAGVALLDLVIAYFHYGSESSVSEKALEPPEYAYIARRPGYLESARTLKVPNEVPGDGLSLRLEAEPRPPVVQPEKETRVTAMPKDGVIAVMDVDDKSREDVERAIDPTLVRNLADQLRVFVANRGWKTIDGSSQRRVFEEQIQAAKLESYKTCVDESCQVELGKALAASHIVRASITRFGGRCVLNGELVDLRSEVIVGAATSTGDCQAEGFLGMAEEVAKRLLP